MLTVHQLRFLCEVVTPMQLDEHSGAALRGNLFTSIWQRFCNNQSAPTCADCPLHTMCPVSALVAPLREEHTRGRDIPRPYIILPPLNQAQRFNPGDTLQFGITLFGSIMQLLPYIMLSTQAIEAAGLGQRLADNDGKRGHFRIITVENYNPLTEECHSLYERGKPLVQVPTVAVTKQDIRQRAEHLPTDRVTLTFLTPLRIIDREHLLHRPIFAPIIHRLLERLMSLELTYGEGASLTVEELWHLVELARQIECATDKTTWTDVKSYSRRQRRFTPLGGLTGQATFTGDLAPFREYLLWGELIHIGKSCVKGDGWYRITNDLIQT